jgi:hypothetical protein
MMPPSGARRPERAVLDAFASDLETRLDKAVPAGRGLEAPALHRLNRTEYANAIRDLLALDVDVASLLPSDASSGGFDNIAEALAVSPSLVQGYVSAAMKISRRAVGDRTLTPTQVTYAVPGGLAQDRHIEGLPLGTRGGMLVRHTFPLDAEYELSVSGGGAGRGGAAADDAGRISADDVEKSDQCQGDARHFTAQPMLGEIGRKMHANEHDLEATDKEACDQQIVRAITKGLGDCLAHGEV